MGSFSNCKLVAGEFGLLEPVENFDIGYQEPFLPERPLLHPALEYQAGARLMPV